MSNHTTGAQRTNARYDKIWEEAEKLRTEKLFKIAERVLEWAEVEYTKEELASLVMQELINIK